MITFDILKQQRQKSRPDVFIEDCEDDFSRSQFPMERDYKVL